MVGKVTLDIALERFEAAPALPENAATLLTVATRYWNDDMISDATYGDMVRKVRDWIGQIPMPSRY